MIRRVWWASVIAIACARPAPPPPQIALPSAEPPAPVVEQTTWPLDPKLLAEAKHTLPLFDDEAPTVTLDQGRIKVEGAYVAPTSPIADTGQLTRIEELYIALEKRREQWQSAHPDQEYPGGVTFWMPATTSALLAKSVLQTAAYAAHPKASLVVREQGTVDRVGRIEVSAFVPTAEQLEAGSLPRTRCQLELRRRHGATLTWFDDDGQLHPDLFARYLLDISDPEKLRSWVATEAETGWNVLSREVPRRERILNLGLWVSNDLSLQSIVTALDGLQESPWPELSVRLFMPEPMRAKPPVKHGDRTVSGRLAPHVIQSVVRNEYGRFRACYEQGLARDPKLEGRITVRFVIGRDGSVTAAKLDDEQTQIPDEAVADCVVRAYRDLRFPKPEGGIVTVVYPIMFSPE